MIKIKNTGYALLLALLMLASASAAGVTSFYWTGSNEHPLYLNPGETKDIYFELQNMVGDSNVTFKAEIVNGTSVARIIDQVSFYEVPLGRKDVKVNLRITVPADAQLGSRHNVGVLFSTVDMTQSGQFTFGSAFEKYFDVYVGAPEPPQVAAAPAEKGMPAVFWIAIVLIVAAVLAVYATRRRHTTAQPMSVR